MTKLPGSSGIRIFTRTKIERSDLLLNSSAATENLIVVARTLFDVLFDHSSVNVEVASSNEELRDDGAERPVLKLFPVGRIKPMAIFSQSGYSVRG